MRDLRLVNEPEFESIAEELDSSISGSGLSDTEDESDHMVPAAAAQIQERKNVNPHAVKPAGSPLVLIASSRLPQGMYFGMYKAFLEPGRSQSSDAVNYLQERQVRPQTGKPGFPSAAQHMFFLCMIGGGHFAAMVVSPLPVSGNPAAKSEPQFKIVAHKTFHRYTTRRKQGGAQSSNDAAKGNAHSAGAGIRRHNEMALQAEVRDLLYDWRDMIAECKRLFVRASGPNNRRTLFGPYDKSVLQNSDPRLRSFPFSTRRPVKSELLRAFSELTHLKVIKQEEKASEMRSAEVPKFPASGTAVPRKLDKPKLSEEEEDALLHTTQLQALIRRSKAPAVLNYLEKNSLSPDFAFFPPDAASNYHAPTPLHFASRLGSAALVTSLLMKGKANPMIPNREGKTAYDLAGDKATRNAFRIARHELGETSWDWARTHCPSALSKDEVAEQGAAQRQESESVEQARREAEMERLKEDERKRAKSNGPKMGSGKTLGGDMSGLDLRENEARGLPPEMKATLERERRARAAEERLKKLSIR